MQIKYIIKISYNQITSLFILGQVEVINDHFWSPFSKRWNHSFPRRNSRIVASRKPCIENEKSSLLNTGDRLLLFHRPAGETKRNLLFLFLRSNHFVFSFRLKRHFQEEDRFGHSFEYQRCVYQSGWYIDQCR